jgi:hypothetical protein
MMMLSSLGSWNKVKLSDFVNLYYSNSKMCSFFGLSICSKVELSFDVIEGISLDFLEEGVDSS